MVLRREILSWRLGGEQVKDNDKTATCFCGNLTCTTIVIPRRKLRFVPCSDFIIIDWGGGVPRGCVSLVFVYLLMKDQSRQE